MGSEYAGVVALPVRRAFEALTRRLAKLADRATALEAADTAIDTRLDNLEAQPYTVAATLTASGTAAPTATTTLDWTVSSDPAGIVTSGGTSVDLNGSGLWLASVTVDGAADWAAGSSALLRLGLDIFNVPSVATLNADRMGAVGISSFDGTVAGLVYNAGGADNDYTATLQIVRLEAA